MSDWYGCYDGTRRDLFTAESNRHPAKMAVGLCYRIFEHGRQRGYWKPQRTIIVDKQLQSDLYSIGRRCSCNVNDSKIEDDKGFPSEKFDRTLPSLPHDDRARIREAVQRIYPDMDIRVIDALWCEECGGLRFVPANTSITIPGDRLLDPMSGIATTLIVGASLGYRMTGIELETHFLELAKQNIELLMSKMPQAPRPEIYQGDARRLSEVLGHADGCLTSPPYAGNIGGDSGIDPELEKKVSGKNAQHKIPQVYDAAIFSPPYSDQSVVSGAGMSARILREVKERGMDAAVKLYRETVMDTQPAHGRWTDENIRKHIEAAIATKDSGYSGIVNSPPYPSEFRAEHLGTKGGQIALENQRGGSFRGYADGVISSPPYSETHVGNPGEQALAAAGEARKIGTRATGHGGKGRHGFQYSHDETAQIGNLKDPAGDIDAVVSSPPYNREEHSRWKGTRAGEMHKGRSYVPGQEYGHAEGQLGNVDTPTYLSAMLQVYREMWKVLEPGAVAVLVTKNPVKAGKIRRLDSDTIRLMEAAGFVLIERHRAMLREYLGAQATLDGPEKPIVRERKSFFKRLHERKHPELAVNFEDILWFRKSS